MATPAPTQARFIDLFAGIGGMRLGLEAAGGHCVFSCERDRYARRTYALNFVEDEQDIAGDIREVQPSDVPDHDVLVAGFPCQPFSLAGVSKKNSLGREHGFGDETQGTLFFNIAEILAVKQPRALLLENVKNLASHDRGRTFETICATLDRLGYALSTRVIDARTYVPQHRQRIFIAGIHRDDPAPFSLDDVRLVSAAGCVGDVLHPEDGTEVEEHPFTRGSLASVDQKYTLSDRLWAYLQAYAQKHRAAGNGFGYGIVQSSDPYTRTLSARYHKDGSEILVSRGPGQRPRRLTPREASRLMGFSVEDFPGHVARTGHEKWLIPVSDTQAYRQFGNAVVPQVVRAIAEPLLSSLRAPSAVVEAAA